MPSHDQVPLIGRAGKPQDRSPTTCLKVQHTDVHFFLDSRSGRSKHAIPFNSDCALLCLHTRREQFSHQPRCARRLHRVLSRPDPFVTIHVPDHIHDHVVARRLPPRPQAGASGRRRCFTSASRVSGNFRSVSAPSQQGTEMRQASIT